ncbi:MAG: hypothetical protein VKK97_13410 [Synechococcaceae cyanobacterium]|nr:hypothetical protein [Synechococcaceae cyanobacterium]
MPWVGLVQILIGTALLVLFLVMLNRAQEQSRQLERLELRLQSLENMRSLERTSALEAQLRKLLARLQTLEAADRQLNEQLEALQALTEAQGRRPVSPLLLPALPPPAERLAPRRAQGPERLAEPPSAAPSLLRPAPDDMP